MDSAAFVSAIKQVVRDSAVKDTIECVRAPAGRAISERRRLRAHWYNALSGTDKEMIESVVREAVHSAVFGMLAVLDGVRAIEDTEQKGRLELKYIGATEHLLNDPEKEFLHDLYNVDLDN